MANVLVEEQSLQDIADAIREVTSTEDKLKPSEMGNAQRNFAKGLIDQANATTGKEDTTLTGAVGSLVEGFGQGGITPSGTIEITENGTYDVTEYASASVEVQGGSDSYYVAFWNAKQQNGKRTNYTLAFNSPASNMGIWTDELFIPIYDLHFTEISNAFRYSDFVNLKKRVEDLNIIFDTSSVTSFDGAFRNCVNLTYIPPIDATSAVTMASTFQGCSKLKKIELNNLKESTSFSITFGQCVELEEVTITGTIGKSIAFANSPLLSDASIQNIIDCLANLTGQTAQTLTLHKDVKAKLTEEQIATITSKNWTLA